MSFCFWFSSAPFHSLLCIYKRDTSKSIQWRWARSVKEGRYYSPNQTPAARQQICISKINAVKGLSCKQYFKVNPAKKVEYKQEDMNLEKWEKN